MKKNDILLAIIVLIIAATGFLFYKSLGKKDTGTVIITVDGNVFGTYSLEKDREISIGDTNYLTDV